MKPFFSLFLLLALAAPVAAQTAPPAETGTANYTDYLLQNLTPVGSASLMILSAEDAQTMANIEALRESDEGSKHLSHFQTRRFGRIVVVAPRQTPVYNDRLRPVTPAETDFFMSSYQLPSLLLATFTKAQWTQAASPEGIGAGDLTGKQAALWEQIVPEPFAYRRRPVEGAESLRRLSAAERGQVRFRVKLTAQIRAQITTDPETRSTIVMGKRNPLKNGQDRAVLVTPDDPEIAPFAPPPKKDNIADEQGEWRYGQLVVTQTPYRLKPTDLRLASDKGDAPRVSLAPPVPDKPLTVGAVVERLRGATGVELYAHKRLAGFVLRGGALASDETFPAGDVLAAIAFAAQGTVRRMPSAPNDDAPLFVLTRDIEPVGRQVERIRHWNDTNDAPGEEAAEAAEKRIVASDPLPLLRFDADDPFAFPDTWRERLGAAVRADQSDGYFGFELKKSGLSTERQKMVSVAVAKRNETVEKRMAEGGSDNRVGGEKLWASANVRYAYKVLDESFLGGEVGEGYLGSYGDWLPPLPPAPDPAPVTSPKRALLLSADNEEAARQAVRWAKRAESSALWLRAATPAILAAATREAGSEMPVLGVVTLLSAANAPANLPRDADLFGEPSNTLLAPDDSAVLAWLTNRLLHLAAVPNLAGMIWENLLPVGYRGAGTDRYSGKEWTGGNDRESGWGYTNAARRQFLREHGADPADLLPVSYYGLSEADNETAAFGTNEALTKEWENARRDALPALLTAARNAVGKMPVYLAGEARFEGKKGEPDTAVFFAPWKNADEPPVKDLYRGTWNKTPPLPDAKTGAYLAVVSPRTGLAASELLTRTKRTNTPALSVMDWSERTVAEIEAELKARGAATP